MDAKKTFRLLAQPDGTLFVIEQLEYRIPGPVAIFQSEKGSFQVACEKVKDSVGFDFIESTTDFDFIPAEIKLSQSSAQVTVSSEFNLITNG